MFVKQINTTVKFTGNDATAAANEVIIYLYIFLFQFLYIGT